MSRGGRDGVRSRVVARVWAVQADLLFWQGDVMIFVFELWVAGFTGCWK
jgi:hypothetical protein